MSRKSDGASLSHVMESFPSYELKSYMEVENCFHLPWLSTEKSQFARVEPRIFARLVILYSGEVSCKGAQLVTYFLSQSLKRSHTRFKTGSIYLLREFQLLRTEIGCLKSSASVPRLLLISQRKEFCSAAQTFLCIFLRRSLTMALAVASSEKELHCVAIPFCLHGWLVFPKG